jgi:Domain of unknown function (DUF4034)
MKRKFSWLVVALVICGFAACKEKPTADAGLPPVKRQKAPKEVRRPGAENIEEDEKGAAKKLRAVKDPVQEQIHAFRVEMRQLYNNRNFDELEKKAAELRAGKETFGNGSWKIYQFHTAFACWDEDPESMWQLHHQIHRDWIAAKPESVTAKVAYADFFRDYAWHARGSGFADTVTEEGWKLLKERLAAASDILKEVAKLPEKDPYWGAVILEVALGEGWPKEKYDAVMAKLTTEEPTFWGYDVARANSLKTRWYGEPGDWEAYAETASARPGGLGDEIYARIVINEWPYYDNVFHESKASWPKTRSGLEQLRKKYPDSLEFVNLSALLATMAEDRAVANEMFDIHGDTYLPAIWGRPERFAHYRNWAHTGRW